MGLNQVETRDFGIEVGNGNIPGLSQFTVFGRVTDVGANASSDLWDPGGDIILPSGGTITVESDNANDDVGGTGAISMTIIGLDASNAIQTDTTILMDGTTPVATSTSWNAIFRAFITSTGAANENVGTITLKDGSNTISQILPAFSSTQNGYFIIPADTQGQIKKALGNVVASKQAVGIKEGELELRLRFPSTNHFVLSGSSPVTSRSGQVVLDLNLPDVIPALTMLKLRYKSHQKNTKITGAAEILMEAM